MDAPGQPVIDALRGPRQRVMQWIAGGERGMEGLHRCARHQRQAAQPGRLPGDDRTVLPRHSQVTGGNAHRHSCTVPRTASTEQRRRRARISLYSPSQKVSPQIASNPYCRRPSRARSGPSWLPAAGSRSGRRKERPGPTAQPAACRTGRTAGQTLHRRTPWQGRSSLRPRTGRPYQPTPACRVGPCPTQRSAPPSAQRPARHKMGGYPSISPTWSTTMGLELVSPGKNPPEESTSSSRSRRTRSR